MARTASLHWCKAQDVPEILNGEARFIDERTVVQGIDVQFFSRAWQVGYQPHAFWLRREAFVLRKLVMKLGGRWHPVDGFEAQHLGDGMWDALIPWGTGAGNVSRQAHYFFADDQKNRSGRLTVSNEQFYLSRSGLELTGEATAKVPGVVGVTFGGHAGKSTLTHVAGASQDPDVRFVLMHAGGEGDADLASHVASCLEAESPLRTTRPAS
jgi:hypothetical protein